MNCMSEFRSVASGATTALDGNGYVWRAVDAPNGTSTAWNISWVAGDGSAGWLHFSVAGQDANDLTCEFIGKGTFDDAITHDRDAIPSVLPLEAVEERLMNDQRFPALTGSQALFTSNGFQPETRIGYLVIVPGTGFGFNFGDLFGTTGATTVDVQRQWEEGGLDHRFSLLVDATDGRVIGWTKLSSEA